MCISKAPTRTYINNGRKEETTDREEISADETRPSSFSLYIYTFVVSFSSKRCEEAQRRERVWK
jgi:hypothetical protein